MMRNAQPRNAREAEERDRALAALATMRRDKASLRAAASAAEIDSATVKRYVGSALRKDQSGHYRASRYDRIPRTLNFLTPTGPVAVTVRDSRTASKIAEHSNAVRKYVRTGDVSALEAFKNESFRAAGINHRFVTGVDALDQLADAGSLTSFESLYYARVAS